MNTDSGYCLYVNALAPAYQHGRLQALIPHYSETNTAEEEPAVRLRGECGDQSLLFDIEFDHVQYEIRLLAPKPDSLTTSLVSLLQATGFIPVDALLMKQCPLDGIENTIFDLDRQLSTM